MSNPRHELGLRAEAAVAAWLARCGWRILATRHRVRGVGEVDVVALDPSEVLVALEVRARRSTRTGAAATTLDGRRVGRLARTLAGYAERSPVRHRGLRIDLVTVEPDTVTGWRMVRHPAVGER
jgi:Holliday junction resolvase-like predicted endonuclease